MLVKANLVYDGIQLVYKFANSYGASVVKHSMTMGFWELAVTKWVDDEWEIVRDTIITKGVLGWLTLHDVNDLLVKIEAL